MEILGLLGDSRARRAVRAAIQCGRRGTRAVAPGFLASWEELHRELSGPFRGVVVVDPFFGGDEERSLRELEKLRRTLGGWGIVLYSAPCGRWGHVMNELATAGFPIHLTLRVDDHPTNLLRSLAAAASSRWIPMMTGALEGPRRPGAGAILEAVLSHWPRAENTPALGRNLKESERNLRRKLEANGLAAPGRILRCVRLLDATSLTGLGVATVLRLASLLGYEDPSSLRRCFVDLTGETMEDFLGPGGEKRLAVVLAKVVGPTKRRQPTEEGGEAA